MDGYSFALFIDSFIQWLLFLILFYFIFDKFVNNRTVFDLLNLSAGDPDRIIVHLEPSLSKNDSNEQNCRTLFFSPEIYVTVIIPTINQSKKIIEHMEQIIQYFLKRRYDESFSWEIIVADDGSVDDTQNKILNFCSKYQNIYLVRLPLSLGIGASIQIASSFARGKYLFVLSPKFSSFVSEFSTIESLIFNLETSSNPLATEQYDIDSENKKSGCIIFGFQSKNKLPFFSVFKSLFNQSNSSFLDNPIDVQTLFIFLNRTSAQMIFPNLHIHSMGFLYEAYYISSELGMKNGFYKLSQKTEEKAHCICFSSLFTLAFFYTLRFWSISNKSPISDFSINSK